MAQDNSNSGDMSVREAGEKGGQATSQTHGREHYEEIGHKGGRRVSDLVDKGKQAEDTAA
jgi:general stress protein YciG